MSTFWSYEQKTLYLFSSNLVQSNFLANKVYRAIINGNTSLKCGDLRRFEKELFKKDLKLDHFNLTKLMPKMSKNNFAF